eukprot:6202669-Pleurochrysis_carterae.AAC.2
MFDSYQTVSGSIISALQGKELEPPHSSINGRLGAFICCTNFSVGLRALCIHCLFPAVGLQNACDENDTPSVHAAPRSFPQSTNMGMRSHLACSESGDATVHMHARVPATLTRDVITSCSRPCDFVVCRSVEQAVADDAVGAGAAISRGRVRAPGAADGQRHCALAGRPAARGRRDTQRLRRTCVLESMRTVRVRTRMCCVYGHGWYARAACVGVRVYAQRVREICVPRICGARADSSRAQQSYIPN